MVTTWILPTGPTRKNNRGFSFIEIMVVMAIIALMAAIVLPAFNRMFTSITGAREGQKVLGLLEKARAEAILKAEPVGITFYTNGRCSLPYRGTVVEYDDMRMAVLTNKLEKIVQTFQPDGTAELGSMTFRTVQGEYVIYTFNPVTGKIEMERRSTL